MPHIKSLAPHLIGKGFYNHSRAYFIRVVNGRDIADALKSSSSTSHFHIWLLSFLQNSSISLSFHNFSLLILLSCKSTTMVACRITPAARPTELKNFDFDWNIISRFYIFSEVSWKFHFSSSFFNENGLTSFYVFNFLESINIFLNPSAVNRPVITAIVSRLKKMAILRIINENPFTCYDFLSQTRNIFQIHLWKIVSDMKLWTNLLISTASIVMEWESLRDLL